MTKKIETIYPLTAVQEGMLFHYLASPVKGVYVGQLSCELRGALDVEAFRGAWRKLVERHAVLRTAFVWEEAEQPVQVVMPRVELPLVVEDWRGRHGAEECFRAHLERDLRQGFDLSRAPLLRLWLLRTGEHTHRFLWTQHHVVLDGWSLALLLDELFRLYEGRTRGRDVELERRRPYRDYVRWLRSAAPEGPSPEGPPPEGPSPEGPSPEGTGPGTAEAYWRRILAGLRGPTELTFARGPAREEGGREERRHPVAQELGARLEHLARQHRLTLNTLVQGAWALFLSRTSAEREVTFGAVVSGRPPALSGVESMVGLFINTLPVRFQVPEKDPVLSWLGALRRHQVELQDHESTPLVKIRSWSGLPAGTPLFESIVVFENYPVERAAGKRAALEIADVVARESAHYPVVLMAVPGEAGLELRLSCERGRADSTELERVLRCLERILTGLAEDPQRPVDSIELLSPAERRELLEEWNATGTAYDGDGTLHGLVEATARRAPGAVALAYEGYTLTYGELDRRANALAHRLRQLGVGPETRVGVALERSLELPLALLAILKAGGAWVPLDPSYPESRRRFMQDDADLAVLLVGQAVSADSAVPVVHVDPADSEEADAAPRTDVTGTNAAYVIYTSGSTGRPKGVVNTHAGIRNRLLWMQAEYGLTAEDRVLQKTPTSFDVSVWELFWPLVTGACEVLARPRGHRDSRYLLELVAREEITTLHFVPAMLEAFLEEEPRAGDLSDLRRVMASGEALPGELARRFQDRLPEGSPARLHNLYGPTEAAVDVTYHACLPEEPAGVPIGRPVANTRLYVLDPRMRPVPVGVPGHLHLAGVQLARGYHRRPAATAAAFVPDPFSTGEGERLYRTGDLTCYRSDGEVEFLGRIDHQVKVRGFRIELGEIEEALRRCPGVTSAVVTLRGDLPGGPGLVAWVVRPPRGGAGGKTPAVRPELEEARAFVAAELPEHMVPSRVVQLSELPTNPSGKVDRRALGQRELPAPDGMARPGSGAPRTPAEEKMALVWSDVLGTQLGHDSFGVDDSFFELGGHSLLALRLAARVRRDFGVELPVTAIFAHPTVAGLTSAVGKAGATQAAELPGSEEPLVHDAANRFEPFALTDVQQAYWIGRRDDFELGSTATQVYLEIDSESLDLDRLQDCWRQLVARHDMLRAVIDDDGRQRVLEEVAPYVIETRDLRAQAQDRVEAEIEAVRRRMTREMLPAGRWPLFELRATLLDGGRHRLHVRCDALIADAWSFQVLARELARFYLAPEDERGAPEPLGIAFRDYVLAERELRRGDAYRQAREYWLRRLPELPPAPQLPLARRADAASPEARHFTRRNRVLPAERWSELKRRAARARLTPSGVLLAAFGEVLANWSRSPRFTLNLTLFNRLPLHPQVDRLVGDFTSLTLLEVDTTAGKSFAERARRLQERLWNDLEHRLMSGVEVLRELRRRGEATLMPVVFTSTLNLAPPGEQDADLELPGELVTSLTQTPQVWLDQQVGERRGSLVLNWDAVEELFPEGLLDAMWNAYGDLLERLARGDDAWNTPVLFSPIPHEPREAPSIPQEAMHTRVLAAAVPRAAPAVITHGRRTLTHGELAGACRRLAHRLRHAGTRPGELVAVVLEKGWEQAVAVLAVQAAGAAYLPVDPELPAERLRHLLEAGRAGRALTLSRWSEGPERLLWPAGVELLCVDRETPGAAQVDGEPTSLPRPNDLAYVIYTSGSTGLPKGVMIDHRSAVNTLADVERRFAVGPGDRVLALSSLSFDLSVFDLFGLLAAGGTAVFPAPEARRDPAHWAELVVAHEVTIWNSVPALLELYVEYLEQHPEKAPESLRLTLLSGDWIPVTLPDRLRELCPGAEVVSLGGATEGAIWSILYRVGEVDPAWTSIPYGTAMDHQEVHVLDGALRPRPLWVTGDLYIGGAGVARGYWRDPGRTAWRFLPDPLCPRPGKRLYRTGDLGRALPDGRVEFLGREDFQVKVRGHRVELGEVESALASHPAVSDAVVTAPRDRGGERRLAAWVVTHRAATQAVASAEELRAHVANRLPAYMVPPFVELLESLPLTANGKVDRGSLERRTHAGTVDAPASAAPAHSPWLERIAPLIREVFPPAREPEADLLELGASSVDLIRIANRLEAELHFRPPIHEMYAQPSIAGLAGLYERHAAAPVESRVTSASASLADGALTRHEALAASFELLADPEEREAHKRRRPGYRRFADGERGIALEADTSAATARLFEVRASYRHFRPEPIPGAAFGRFLSALREDERRGEPKYLYGSAGSLYPVRTYVAVKPGRIEGLPAGTYYHDPVDHRLVTLEEGAELPRELCDPLVNGPILGEAAFALFLVAELAAVGPIYGVDGARFAILEAGYMSQLLMMLAPEQGLGLCPIGRLDFERIRASFHLGESQVLAHCLFGGAIDFERRHSPVLLEPAALPEAAEEEREEGEI